MSGESRTQAAPGVGYRFLRALLRLAVAAFFRRVEVVGLHHVYQPGAPNPPIIFCGNHPNSLLDPVLIIVFCRRIVHFAAKDTLFASPVARAFLSRLGAVPIRRRQDHEGQAVDNRGTFDRLFEVLAAGRCMGIFPEGISHVGAELAAIKTGAARIALGCASTHPHGGLRVVPCGIHYVNRHRFRTSVLLQFGEPLTIDERWVYRHKEDEAQTVRTLTDEIEHALRGLTVNAKDWDTIRVLDGVRRLYQPADISLHDRVELARRFNRLYPDVAERPEVRALYQRVRSHLVHLETAGISVADLERTHSPFELVVRSLGNVLWIVLWIPLALVGAPIHLPIAIALKVSGKHLAPRKDVVATTKFVAGFFLYLSLYAAAATLVGWWTHWWVGAIVFVLLPLSGHASLIIYERFGSLDRKWGVLWNLLRRRNALSMLRTEHQLLRKDVVAAVQRLIPDDMEPLFPAQAHAGEEEQA